MLARPMGTRRSHKRWAYSEFKWSNGPGPREKDRATVAIKGAHKVLHALNMSMKFLSVRRKNYLRCAIAL
jgi:hypothetical protein